MKDITNKVKEETVVKGIAETIIALILLAGSAVWGTIKLVSENAELSPYKPAFLISGLVFAVAGAGMVYRLRNKKNIPKFEKIESDFVIERLEIRYQWKSPQEITYTRHYKLRVLKNDVDRFTDKFRWSCDGKLDVKSITEGHRVERHPPDGLYDFFDIRFDRPYCKNEVIETSVRWELDDLKCTSRPFISRTIHEPTEELLLTAELPSAWDIQHFTTEESPDAGAKKNVKASTKPAINGQCKWPPKAPLKLLHHYQIRWQWPSHLKPKP